VTDPTGPASGSIRVYRGGCFVFFARLCRSAYRYGRAPGYRNVSLGFRAARTYNLSPDKQVASPATKAPAGKVPNPSPTAKAAPAKTPAEKTAVATVKKHMTPAQLALGDPVVNSVGMLLVPIPAGTFTMGRPAVAHKVTLTKPFLLGQHEVTQEQYEKVMGTNPSKFKGKQNPVEGVSWNDAVEFCRKLSQLSEEKAAGYVYRLPTEAEWECACRAETTTKYSFGDSASELGAYGWYDENSEKTTHPVGGKKPNPWGLYDMHGNVFEWCQDWYGDYPSGSVTDPTGAASGSSRVIRGGGWYGDPRLLPFGEPRWNAPGFRRSSLGFRVLRSSIK